MHWILFAEFVLYYLLSIILIVIFYSDKPKRFTNILVAISIYIVLAVPCTWFWLQTNYLSVIPLLISYVASLNAVFKTVKIRTIIAMFLMIYSVNVSISSLIVMILNVAYDYRIREMINLVVMIILVAIGLAIAFAKKTHVKYSITYIPFHIKRLTISSVLLSAMVIQLISDYNTFESIAKYNTILRIMVTLLMICIGAAFPLMIASCISKAMHSEQLECFQRQIQTQSEHYKALSRSNEDIRRFKHDYKNMRIAVRSLIEGNKIQEAMGLLDSFDAVSGSKERFLYNFDTGNGIADALLADKQHIAEQINTVIEFEGAIPQDTISPSDLCIVLGNTLDNAIEASERLPDEQIKTIKIVCKKSGGYLFLKVTNSVMENIKISSNFLPTTKEDKKSHGFGLYSLNKTVDKYHGTLNMCCEDNVFCTEIELEIGA